MEPLQLIILIGAGAALILVIGAILLTRYVVRTKDSALLAQRDSRITLMENQLQEKDRVIEDARQDKADSVGLIKEHYERSIKDLKAAHEKALTEQLSALRHEMTSRTEEILKAREEELKEAAETSFKSITGGLDENLKAMKEAFEKNKEAHLVSSTALKTSLEAAVETIQKKAVDIGSKADNLAEALKGSNKFQGDWGEVILENIFIQEGLTAPRDYQAQESLRDEMGHTLRNEDSDSLMRPDFILHYPDGYDIIVDCKVNLAAYYDWTRAESDKERSQAAAEHLAAVRRQVENLSKKDYSSYLAPDHKRLDFVVMFVPVYPALRLAHEMDPNLFQWARSKNVLITTEETIMPFLRVIRIAWTNMEQAQNQQLIIAAAEKMIARVSDFCKDYQAVGAGLESALAQFRKGEIKLRDSGPSIVTSANQIIRYGVPRNPKKPLPPVLGSTEEPDDE